MGTFLTDKCEEIRNWLAIGSDIYPDSIITSWIRMAEEQLSTELRVKHMIQIDISALHQERVPLPLDWQEIRLVRLVGETGVLRYNTPDDFFNSEYPDAPESPYVGKEKRYTILGNFLVVGGTNPTTGLAVELTYYQSIPALTDDANNWINYYHPSVYTLKILHIASMYAIEDDRGPMWQQQVIGLITEMNVRHHVDKASGSVLVPVRKKTFG